MCATTGMAVLLSLPAGLAGPVRDLLEPSSLAAVAAVCQHLAVDTWHARRLRRHAHHIAVLKAEHDERVRIYSLVVMSDLQALSANGVEARLRPAKQLHCPHVTSHAGHAVGMPSSTFLGYFARLLNNNNKSEWRRPFLPSSPRPLPARSRPEGPRRFVSW